MKVAWLYHDIDKLSTPLDFYKGNPSVTGSLRVPKACNARFIFCCHSEQTCEQAVELFVIFDFMKYLWRLCLESNVAPNETHTSNTDILLPSQQRDFCNNHVIYADWYQILCRELVKWTWYNGRDIFFHITSGRINTCKGVNQLKELYFLNSIIIF